jgi:hypothetical protein
LTFAAIPTISPFVAADRIWKWIPNGLASASKPFQTVSWKSFIVSAPFDGQVMKSNGSHFTLWLKGRRSAFRKSAGPCNGLFFLKTTMRRLPRYDRSRQQLTDVNECPDLFFQDHTKLIILFPTMCGIAPARTPNRLGPSSTMTELLTWF